MRFKNNQLEVEVMDGHNERGDWVLVKIDSQKDFYASAVIRLTPAGQLLITPGAGRSAAVVQLTTQDNGGVVITIGHGKTAHEIVHSS